MLSAAVLYTYMCGSRDVVDGITCIFFLFQCDLYELSFPSENMEWGYDDTRYPSPPQPPSSGPLPLPPPPV
jgi:hypothetical protein